MDMRIKDSFVSLWRKRFGEAELPITFFYTDQEGSIETPRPPAGHECLLGVLAKVRAGKPLRFDAGAIGCGGGKRYLGFTDELMPNFEYFLSCGIPGSLEGERYKKTPGLVKQFVAKSPRFRAPGKFIVFKRWEALEASDNPEVAIFFGRPDVLSGLFTLANFAEAEAHGVIAPFAAGCGTIVQYPYLEGKTDHPRAVLGMFDVSARPFVPGDVLSFAVPMGKLRSMIEDMEDSFLITPSWRKVRRRLS
ncbi:MAG TPA: DUF169 domain-containing protein [Candidatus Methylomirabilis sp.]|nr:DUF169 domain-containing protein [Candidatus Methylomirabilis sp.]